MAGANGGGAFVLVYLGCVLIVGLPIMMSEILLGRRGRQNPVATMRSLGEEEAGQSAWSFVGAMGVLAGFLILSYYSVIAGWTLAYAFKAGSGMFTGASPAVIGAEFSSLVESPWACGGWHTLFMLFTVAVVARGVERGLEQAVRVMVPGLVAIMVVLLGYAINSGDFAAGIDFMFAPDFAALSATGVLAAMGQAFFTLSIGMGAVMAYGAYLPQETSITSTSVSVAVADTAVALLAGMVIFPIVFGNGLDPAEGPGLVFQVLPLAFGGMAGGSFFGTLFFVLLAFGALTSAISLMEPAVAWVVERFGFTRVGASMLVGTIIWVLGFTTVFSFNIWSSLTFFKGTLFDNVDFVTSNIMLPAGGFFITIFAGWVMCRNSTADELDPEAAVGYRIWRFLARFVAPAGVILVFLNAFGVFD